MQKILVVGAGKTSTFLIDYLLLNAETQDWQIIVADGHPTAAADRIKDHKCGKAVVLDITNDTERRKLIRTANIVLSLMPPQLHILIAKDCLQYKKHLITSSYISDDMAQMDEMVKDAELMFMCEMGLDPGIDHMTASQIIHSIHKVAANITSFKSYCGGLIAPESDDNPWHYKFTWNPWNVVVAGSAGATYLSNNKEIEVAYPQMFEDCKKTKKIGLVGPFAYYPNRDSLDYLDKYEVSEVKTFLRATLREPQFCKGWDAIVKLGLTDTKDKQKVKDLTYVQWVADKNDFDPAKPLDKQVSKKLGIDEDTQSMLAWLGIFEHNAITLKKNSSSAEILLDLLLPKWEMKEEDKDMIVMQHEVEYNRRGTKSVLTSSMVLIGENKTYSAMAKTVGMPMGILAKLVLTGKVQPPVGVCIPNMSAVYKPVLAELEEHGIAFVEEVV